MKKFFSLVVLFFVITTYGAVTVNVNGSNYSIPQTNERGWGTAVTSWIQAISSNTLQPVGGSFTLSNDVDFGPNFGLKTSYLLSRNTNPSTAGLLRLNVADSIGWRNNANNGNLLLGVNGSNQLTFNGSALLSSGNIVNADISASAGIDASKIANGQISNTEFQGLDGVSAPIVTTTGTQSLSNKDIDGGTASNSNRITIPKAAKTTLDALTRKQGTIVYDTTSNKPYYDDGANLKVIGSGSGGATNLIEDGDAESGFSNFVEGSYSAATRPSGTFTASSGSGAFAISTSSSNPIFGSNSLLLTKSSGASRQGRAIERTINLDSGYRTKMLKTRIDYTIVSGSFVAGSNGSSPTDSSLIWYVGQYNGSTWTYTEPSTFKMFSNSTTNSDWVEGEFQVNSDTTQLKLIGFISESANSAWVVKAEVGFRLSAYLAGTTISGAVSRTFTLTNSGNATVVGTVSQIGERAILSGTITIGSSLPTSSITLNLPTGYSMAESGYLSGSVSGAIGANTYTAAAYATSATSIIFAGPNSATWAGTVPSTWANGNLIKFDIEVKIQGWSSSTQQSDGYDGRLVTFDATFGTSFTATTGGAWTKITGITAAIDKASGLASSTYTVKTSGIYKVEASVALNASTTGLKLIAIYKNGTQVNDVIAPQSTSYGQINIFKTLELNAGDTIDLYYQNYAATETWSVRAYSITKLQAPTTISATERVAAIYSTTSQTITAGGARQIVNASTKELDDFNAVTTGASWKFTAPVAGLYEVKYVSEHSSVTLTTGASLTAELYKNGSLYKPIAAYAQQAATAVSPLISGAVNVSLNAGEYVDVREAVGGSVSATISNATIYITRLK